MDERLFATLADWLSEAPVVLCSVLDAQGATPRKRGSRMLVRADDALGSIGGGLAEARVLERARALLAEGSKSRAVLDIDLGGGADSAGICGGRMQMGLRRFAGAADRAHIASIASTLQSGQRVALDADLLGGGSTHQIAPPNVRLIIAGAGHCGAALCELAEYLGYEICVFDTREDLLRTDAFKHASHRSSDLSHMHAWLDTEREVQAVLLNRNFEQDVELLRVLCRKPPRFLGMMGSKRRIAEVRRALPVWQHELASLVAPVGIDIDAQTPHEIAVSILAQLIEQRAQCRLHAFGA